MVGGTCRLPGAGGRVVAARAAARLVRAGGEGPRVAGRLGGGVRQRTEHLAWNVK
ncbi:hypothetical protein JYU34_003035 [Plutella xylostella]|uniref:Uncharacterized protein n=1 Tax=Plutella xylostella TaxID=51655 RepID=A0ABQ7QZ07_PLUXY|nr:hypothetical protein JYU34_003035 [Plutella xylostella]